MSYVYVVLGILLDRSTKRTEENWTNSLTWFLIPQTTRKKMTSRTSHYLQQSYTWFYQEYVYKILPFKFLTEPVIYKHLVVNHSLINTTPLNWICYIIKSIMILTLYIATCHPQINEPISTIHNESEKSSTIISFNFLLIILINY